MIAVQASACNSRQYAQSVAGSNLLLEFGGNFNRQGGDKVFWKALRQS